MEITGTSIFSSVPQAHDGALAILFFDVTQGLIQGLGLIRRNLIAHKFIPLPLDLD